MDINFELYKVFFQVAKNLSFSQAAAELYISQSAVSQSIKQLETKLNCTLLARSTKQVKLTVQGQILFTYVEQAYNFLKIGERQLEALQALTQGEVRIGATDTICKHYLLPFLREYRRLYPGINLHITTRTSPGCLELLEKGAVDLIVVNLPEQPPAASLRVVTTTPLQDIFVASPDFPGLVRGEISLPELAAFPLLLLEKQTATRDFLDKLLQLYGVQVRPEIELDSVDLLIELAKTGLGITYVVKDYVLDALKRGQLVEIPTKEGIPQRSLGIITQANIPLPPAAEQLLSLLTSPESGLKSFQTPVH